MALLDLTTYKGLLGVQSGDTRNDAQITALLEPASAAVRTYTGRSFELSTRRTTRRSFVYDGSGFLDIDDCTTVTGLSVAIPNVLPVALGKTEWSAMPGDGPIYYYLVLHGGVTPFATSPEMGFTRNLDQYPAITYKQPLVRVTATWGWPEIPQDVKLATALIIKQYLPESGGGAEGLSAEAIEGWSRSWGGRTGAGLSSMAIPNRARDLLAAYQRVFA
jgi:hypothetical protein